MHGQSWYIYLNSFISSSRTTLPCVKLEKYWAQQETWRSYLMVDKYFSQLLLINPDSFFFFFFFKATHLMKLTECHSLCFQLDCWPQGMLASTAMNHIAMSKMKRRGWFWLSHWEWPSLLFGFNRGTKTSLTPDLEMKVAFAFGLAIAMLGQCIGHISSAHLNPAITLRLSVLRASFSTRFWEQWPAVPLCMVLKAKRLTFSRCQQGKVESMHFQFCNAILLMNSMYCSGWVAFGELPPAGSCFAVNDSHCLKYCLHLNAKF